MKIKMEDSALLVVDIQERLLPAMNEKEKLIEHCIRLFKGINTLNVPVIITEQYPKGLGPTCKEVLDELPQAKILEKTTFSCINDEILLQIKALGKKNIIVCGIETHVCVLQTVIDLVDCDFNPVLIADCISSRKANDKLYGIERARAEGAIVTTYESLLFELIGSAKHENFKQISNIVK